jgi:dipeptidyl aminopeptidase/acylaminoacyl peptidase
MQNLAYHLAEIPRNAMTYPGDEEPIGLVFHSADILAYDFSPDGERVAFLARDEETEKDEAHRPVRVWVGSPEESGPYSTLELPGSVSEVSWSPTGSRLAVTMASTSHTGGMAEGGALRRGRSTNDSPHRAMSGLWLGTKKETAWPLSLVMTCS